MKLYFHHLKLFFRDVKNIGLILDKAKMHRSKNLMKYIEDTNIFPPAIHLAYISKNLIAVFSLPDQATIKNIKKEIRIRYEIEIYSRNY